MPTKKRLSRAEAKARTREELLKAARVVFARYGFHGTSLDMVAEAAGYTKGAVYANFSGKDDLYLALLDNNLTEGLGDLDTLITSYVNNLTEDLGGLDEQITSYVNEELLTAGVSLESTHDQITKNFFAEIEDTRDWAVLTVEFFIQAMRNDAIRSKLIERIHLTQDEIKKSLEKRVAITGAKLPMSVEQTATALLAFTNGIDLLALVDPQPEYPAVYAKMLKLLLGLR
ncbi:MAG: TetR/AcrR family transcriptional regulator [Clostridia bacterium]|nr:TetR/AcrR family transcriptional regulator [Clostridia bacterium]